MNMQSVALCERMYGVNMEWLSWHYQNAYKVEARFGQSALVHKMLQAKEEFNLRYCLSWKLL
ncbi:MAG: hypothetical protein RML40_10380 [Bacteroidota bacterium]|nr:hypothetical protein [Bacteroidota bacterium]